MFYAHGAFLWKIRLCRLYCPVLACSASERLPHLLALEGEGLAAAENEDLPVAKNFDGARIEACILQGGCSAAGGSE